MKKDEKKSVLLILILIIYLVIIFIVYKKNYNKKDLYYIPIIINDYYVTNNVSETTRFKDVFDSYKTKELLSFLDIKNARMQVSDILGYKDAIISFNVKDKEKFLKYFNENFNPSDYYHKVLYINNIGNSEDVIRWEKERLGKYKIKVIKNPDDYKQVYWLKKTEYEFKFDYINSIFEIRKFSDFD